MNLIKDIKELRGFIVLWLTQAFSSLGSAMTNYALVIWLYKQHGSALETAMLSVCSYAPYVIMSIFAGALSDKWNKKAVMLICDSFAAACTVAVLILLQSDMLMPWHLYILNALNGLMNTVQQPAADVTISLLTPKKHYQKVSGMKSFSNSLVSIMTPIAATAVLAFTNVQTVIAFDLATFVCAFISLLFFIRIPEVNSDEAKNKSVLSLAKDGLEYLKQNRGIFDLIMFLAAINLTASIYNAALPTMLMSRNGGTETALGIINTVTGVTMLAGSAAASVMPEPKSRVRVICNTLLISMSTENFFLAFGRSVPIWCIGAVLGWIVIPAMNANMDALMRGYIPIELQGRVYAARNTFQFFTIPIGYLLGGILVDKVFEPFMQTQEVNSILSAIFGSGKGSGAALLFFILGLMGVFTCLIFRKDRNIWNLEK